MEKKTIIKNIEETRDAAGRLQPSEVATEVCAAFAEAYVSNSGVKRDIYSYDQLADYYGVNADFASKVVTRAVKEALVSFTTSVKIMQKSAGNQKRKAYFKGEFTSTERRFRVMILCDRFEAIKAMPANEPDKYESLWRGFLSPESISFRRLKAVYGYSTREIMYFVMIAAIRDMADVSYVRFQDIALNEFIELPGYMDYVQFIDRAREAVKDERTIYLDLFEANKILKNQQDPEFQKNYAEAKKVLNDMVSDIVSAGEGKINAFRTDMFGE